MIISFSLKEWLHKRVSTVGYNYISFLFLILLPLPDRFWGSPNLLYNKYLG